MTGIRISAAHMIFTDLCFITSATFFENRQTRNPVNIKKVHFSMNVVITVSGLTRSLVSASINRNAEK